jgi:putative ABC transport system permease protein
MADCTPAAPAGEREFRSRFREEIALGGGSRGRYSRAMTTLTQELRQAWRSLLHRKAYFLACAATLALVLGANAATFAVVNATMLRPMPFATRGEVLQLFSQPPGTTGVPQRNPLQQMEVPRVRERVRALARIEGFYPSDRVVTLKGEPAVVQAAGVTPGLLKMMAAPIAQGRAFLESEGQPGQLVAVVSDRYWRDTLGGGDVLGAPIVIDGQPHTIVGVLSPAYAVPFLDVQVMTPLHASPEPQPRRPPLSVVAVAELAPGASLARAREDLAALSRELAAEFPRTHGGWTMGAQPVREWQYGTMRAPLLMLLAATVLVLLIACVNVANLATAQAIARSGDLALRLALGARPADVLRMHLAELLIVSAAGLVPGLLLAWAAVPALLAVNPEVAKTLGMVSIDWRVQIFSAVVAVLTAAAASVTPALHAMRGQVAGVIAASGSRTTGSPLVARLQRGLVSLEVALCVALLMAGAVVVRGLQELARRSPGYEAAGVLTAQVRLPEPAYATPESRAAVVERLLVRVRALPGVTGASTTFNAFTPGFSFQTLVNVKDRPTPDGQPHTVQFRRVSTDYFATMRIQVVGGRAFGESDVADQPQVAIVSRRFAEQLLPGADPIGQVLVRTAPNSPAMTVVGVVGDVFDVSLSQAPEPTLYLPWAQNNNSNVPVALVIRTSVDPESVAPAVRAVLKEIDATLPLRRVQTLEVFVHESTAPERFRTMVLGIVAVLGLVLAAVGISGVTYRGVVDRTRELAVRLALGSPPGRIVRLVLSESARDLAIGTALGLVGGAALCALLARSLESVGSVDAVNTGVALGLITAVGLLAAYLPALRVLRVHPAEVLRS